MEKKDISLQIATLVVFGAGLIGFYFFDFGLSKGILNALIITIKPYIFWIGLFCYIPPIINLISQTFSKDEETYNPKLYYQTLKFLTHISFFLIVLYLDAFVFALFSIGIMIWTDSVRLAILVPSIIAFVSVFVIDAICIRYFNMHWYNFFKHFQN